MTKDYRHGATRYTWGSTPTDRRFTGQRSEEASLGSLYDYGARFYAPGIMRFISADTIVPDPKNPQSLNRYSYVNNRPLNFTDPTGHFSEDEIKKFFKKDNWDDVLKLFQKDGALEGRWGWLAVLQKGEYGNNINIEWDKTLLPENHPHVDDIFSGKFTKGREGELLIEGVGIFMDQMKAARYGKQYELYVEGKPANAGKVVAGATMIVATDLTLGAAEAYLLATTGGNPIVMKGLELLNYTVVLPVTTLGIALIVDGQGRSRETKLNAPAYMEPPTGIPSFSEEGTRP